MPRQGVLPKRPVPITNYQLPITNYQLPITNYQLPITNYQLLIINHQSPITNGAFAFPITRLPDFPITQSCFSITRLPDYPITQSEISRSPDPPNSSIVACPAADIPSRRTTRHTVIPRIFTSRLRLQWSTYHVSRANFSSQRIAFRPFTCAHPVMPGFTSCRLACSGVYRSRYSITSGRGPTRLNSPRSTFHNCGSSSRLMARSHRPSRVSLTSSPRSLPSPSRASVIVRNLTSSNTFASFPGRLCRNSTGLPSFIRTSAATIAITGDRHTSSAAAITLSNAAFTHV